MAYTLGTRESNNDCLQDEVAEAREGLGKKTPQLSQPGNESLEAPWRVAGIEFTRKVKTAGV